MVITAGGHHGWRTSRLEVITVGGYCCWMSSQLNVITFGGPRGLKLSRLEIITEEVLSVGGCHGCRLSWSEVVTVRGFHGTRLSWSEVVMIRGYHIKWSSHNPYHSSFSEGMQNAAREEGRIIDGAMLGDMILAIVHICPPKKEVTDGRTHGRTDGHTLL